MKDESLVEFGGGRGLPAVLTLLPLQALLCASPAAHKLPCPRQDCRDEHDLPCKHCSCLLEVDLIQIREDILHILLSLTYADMGMLETGAKCLWEYQLVPGADCRRKEQE